MSLINSAEAAATAGTPWGWIRVVWKLAPWLIIAGLSAALIITRGALDHAQMQAKLDSAAAQHGADKAALDDANRTNGAIAAFADKATNLQPVIARSTSEVTHYAETAAGRAPCAAADRVSGIDQLDAALFPADRRRPTARRTEAQIALTKKPPSETAASTCETAKMSGSCSSMLGLADRSLFMESKAPLHKRLSARHLPVTAWAWERF